jgi:hypothetical protein
MSGFDLETGRGQGLYMELSVPFVATVAMEWTPG